MGQKVSPVGMRIGINKDWNSRWYANDKDYHVFLNQDIKIREYIAKVAKEQDAQLSHVEIERTKTEEKVYVKVAILCARSGAMIGAESKTINKINADLKKIVGDSVINVNVVDVKTPDLDATIVANDIAKQLENRVSFRAAQKKAIQRVRKAGAKGIRTIISGRLGGADIARSEGYKDGVIPLHTLRSDIDFAHCEAHTQYGRLGVKVWICRGEILPGMHKNKANGGE